MYWPFAPPLSKEDHLKAKRYSLDSAVMNRATGVRVGDQGEFLES